MDEGQRVAEIMRAAEQLLAELQDTVCEEYPPQLLETIEDDEPDTLVDVEPNALELDTLLESLPTAPAPAVSIWVAYPRLAPAPAPPRSRLRSIVSAVRAWLARRRRGLLELLF